VDFERRARSLPLHPNVLVRPEQSVKAARTETGPQRQPKGGDEPRRSAAG